MRLKLTAVLALGFMLLLVPLSAQAAPRGVTADRWALTHPAAFARHCPQQWQKGPFATKQLVICAIRLGHVPSTGVAIAYNESRDHARAVNWGGCGGSNCYGVFQESGRYVGTWYARYARLYPRDWLDARTNTVIAVGLAIHYGWCHPSTWGGDKACRN